MSTLIAESTLINFATVALLVTLVPGPAFVTILSTALRRGFLGPLRQPRPGNRRRFLFLINGRGSWFTADSIVLGIHGSQNSGYPLFGLPRIAIFGTSGQLPG